MTHEAFVALLEARFDKARAVLSAKSAEYSRNGDNLYNFKRAAQIQGGEIGPAKALLGMWSKHLVSVMDLIDRFEAGEKLDLALVDEKVGDAHNYIILLEAIFKETK